MKRRGTSRTRQTSGRHLSAKQVNMGREADYIISRAGQGICSVVTVPPLVFFSTTTGDAWVLDPDDSLALELARDTARQQYRIFDTPEQFVIEWNASYHIDGDLFVVLPRTGGSRVIHGYPIAEILRAAQQSRFADPT